MGFFYYLFLIKLSDFMSRNVIQRFNQWQQLEFIIEEYLGE